MTTIDNTNIDNYKQLDIDGSIYDAVVCEVYEGTPYMLCKNVFGNEIIINTATSPITVMSTAEGKKVLYEGVFNDGYETV